MPNPKPLPVVLTDVERQVLLGWARRRTTAQALALRSRIVLACAENLSNGRIAEELATSRNTVSKWRARFVADRLQGLSDEPRPGAPRRITDEQVETVILKTLEEAPSGPETHWSTRSMASAAGMSQTAVSRIWRAYGLTPHLAETWQLSTDPLFIDKVRDIAGIYLDPPRYALVLAVDEQTAPPALDRAALVLPATQAPLSRSRARRGATGLFTALDVGSGAVLTEQRRKRAERDFLRFLTTVDHAVPAGLDLHLICDNDAGHKTEAVRRWLARRPRCHVHFAPTSSSWSILVERWCTELTRRRLSQPVHQAVVELEADLRAWISEWHTHPKAFVWTRTTTQIRDAVTAYCQ
ncbi:MAG TPA: IS630 family transposase [Pseudonocardiaceae bacterium]|nr:IS630 family transposase [Pseudonocardiaceae bacterium]